MTNTALSKSSKPEMEIGLYEFSFQATQPIMISGYGGSAWRGLFGHALKRTVCVTHEKECSKCMLKQECSYSYIFETPLPEQSDRMRLYTTVPHPFVLDTVSYEQQQFKPGDEFCVQFTLLGDANRMLPYVIQAMHTAGLQGIGKGKGRFQLLSVSQQENAEDKVLHEIWQREGMLDRLAPFTPSAPEVPDEISLRFNTPFRIKQDGRLVIPETFQFHSLFSSLMRRISMLMYFHMGIELDIDFSALTEASRKVELLDKDLAWQEWTRFSSRQQTKMQMGGVTGSITLRGSEIGAFWPYLWLGQWVNAGKATSMGLGGISISDAASLREQTDQAA